MIPDGYHLLEQTKDHIKVAVEDTLLIDEKPPKYIEWDGKRYMLGEDLRMPDKYWGTLCKLRKYNLKG